MVSKESRQKVRVKKHMKIRNRFSGTAERPRLAVFRSNNHMYAQIIDDTVGNTLVAASTLEKSVKAELEKRCSKVTLIKFADHHNFNESDLKEIELQYNNLKSDNKIIVTTEKDAARLLQHTDKLETIRQEIHVLPIEIEILSEKELFNKLILDYVEENSRNR